VEDDDFAGISPLPISSASAHCTARFICSNSRFTNTSP
jgi:hypothetical protein